MLNSGLCRGLMPFVRKLRFDLETLRMPADEQGFEEQLGRDRM